MLRTLAISLLSLVVLSGIPLLIPISLTKSYGQPASVEVLCPPNWEVGDSAQYYVADRFLIGRGGRVNFEFFETDLVVFRGSLGPPLNFQGVVAKPIRLQASPRSRLHEGTNLEPTPPFVDRAVTDPHRLEIYTTDLQWIGTILGRPAGGDWSKLQVDRIVRLLPWPGGLWPLFPGRRNARLGSLGFTIDVAREEIDLGQPIGRIVAFRVADETSPNQSARRMTWFSSRFSPPVKREHRSPDRDTTFELIHATSGVPSEAGWQPALIEPVGPVCIRAGFVSERPDRPPQESETEFSRGQTVYAFYDALTQPLPEDLSLAHDVRLMQHDKVVASGISALGKLRAGTRGFWAYRSFRTDQLEAGDYAVEWWFLDRLAIRVVFTVVAR